MSGMSGMSGMSDGKIGFSVSGLLWVSKETVKESANIRAKDIYSLELQYETARKVVLYSNKEIRDKTYDRAMELMCWGNE